MSMSPSTTSRARVSPKHPHTHSLDGLEDAQLPCEVDAIVEESIDINRKISVYKHVKKKAANDAQLLMNRIALIQKEEERARKKIQETKERAAEIIALRNENEKRIKAYVNATGEVRQLQQVMLAKNREQELESRKARQQRQAILQSKKKEDVGEMQMEKKYLTALMLQEQQREIEKKQRMRDEVKKAEELLRWKKEQERLEKERRRKEFYAQKLREEEEEAKRAEKLVRLLEKKEREWIERLRNAQTIQDTAFDQLENALEQHVPLRVTMSRAQSNDREGFTYESMHNSQSSDAGPDPYPTYPNHSAERIPEYEGMQTNPMRPGSGGAGRGPMRLSPIEKDYAEFYSQQEMARTNSCGRPNSAARHTNNGSASTSSSAKQRAGSAGKMRRSSSGALSRNTPGLKGRSSL